MIYPGIPEPEELVWARGVLRRAEQAEKQRACAERGHGDLVDISTFGELPRTQQLCNDCGSRVSEGAS